jgi:hypothetical protein
VAVVETSAHRGASSIYISHALLVRVLKGMQTCLIERGCNYLATLRCTVCMLLTAYAADLLSAASCPHPASLSFRVCLQTSICAAPFLTTLCGCSASFLIFTKGNQPHFFFH